MVAQMNENEQLETKTPTKTKRSESFELLRIISMFMVVTLHFLSLEGMLSTSAFSPKWYIAWTLEGLSFIAVNCYVLLSGYFLIQSKFKLKKLVVLWLQVFFYSMVLFIVAVGLGKYDFSVKDFIRCMFPINSGVYWFASVYTVMYIFSPFMNKLIHALTKKQLLGAIAIMVFFFSFVPTFTTFVDVFQLESGYSLVWFVCLYFIASYIRLYSVPKWNGFTWIALYLGFSSVLFISKFVLKEFCDRTQREDISSWFYDYNSLFVLLASICFFLAFSKLKINNKVIKSIILWLSPLTFGVYLIHEHFVMRPIVWNELFNVSQIMTGKNCLFVIAGVVFVVYMLCSFIDWIRKLLMRPLENAKWFDNGCEKITHFFINHKAFDNTKK